jgi:hypothetical protein
LLHQVSLQVACYEGLQWRLAKHDDDSRMRSDSGLSPNRSPSAIPQQFDNPHLDPPTGVLDAVQEQRAPCRKSNRGRAGFAGAWKGVSNMTKNPYEQLWVRVGPAVDRHERLVAAAARNMQPTCCRLKRCAARAMDQRWHIMLGHLPESATKA